MRRRDESGTALIELVWLAILLLVPLLYVVLTVFEAQREAYAASAAARSAGRAFVTAPDQASGQARAEVAARLAYADQGIDDAPALRLSCRPTPRACLVPGSVVRAEVGSRVELPLLPVVFGTQSPAISVSAEHEAPYGTFREAR